jgi:hypothetical protein
VANARRILASTLGAAAGIAGVEHGVFEVVQGHVPPDSIVIASMGPPCVPEEVWNACEPAMTLIPSFLISGLLSIIIGVLVTVWAAAFVQKRHGGLILILLSIALLLVGGGFFPPLIGIVAGIVGAKIHSRLDWWRARGSMPGVRVLAGLWPWVLVAFIVWVFGQWIIGYFFNDWLMENGYLILIFVIGPLVLSPFAALAHDAQGMGGPR